MANEVNVENYLHLYLLKQNNIKNSKVKGKWFAHGKTVEVLNTRKMANHISEHGSIYTPDVVFGALVEDKSSNGSGSGSSSSQSGNSGSNTGGNSEGNPGGGMVID